MLGSDPKSFLDPFSEQKWHEDQPLGDRMTEPSTEEEGREPSRWWRPPKGGVTPGCAHIPVHLSKNAAAPLFSLEQKLLK